MTHPDNEDLVQLLITDHREVEDIFRQLEGMRGTVVAVDTLHVELRQV